MNNSKNRLASDRFKIVTIAPKLQPNSQPKWRSILAIVNHILQSCLAAAGGDEVRIWQTSDRDGNTWWHACDRVTGRSIEAVTESEMRAWLDRRYCQ
ncbi:MAG: hypothetical protein ACRC62_11750 [Microcoleus sp.]